MAREQHFMEKKLNQFSIWSSFENLVEEAEHKFFNHDYEGAIKTWENYAQITGAPGWQQAANDLKQLITNYLANIELEPQKWFDTWLHLRQLMNQNKLNSYAYHIMQRLFARIFLATKQTVSFDLATGIFCFIEKRYETAKENLAVVINHEPDNLLARIFLSKCCFVMNEEEQGNAYLSQAVFLGSNEILAEDIEEGVVYENKGVKVTAIEAQGASITARIVAE